ncbi:MAG: long-chain fatty acid--CoA ligase, partial [Lachnospiraceae bacterium]|nr:long-chain fatty acid--CoA ligase [Lachnospiraceae bacterium]
MKNVIEMLSGSAKRYPDKTAFADPEKSITFGELSDMVMRIATLFLKGEISGPLEPEQGIGFYMEKNVDAVCAMLGGVRAGGFYSFIDVRQPESRARSVISVLQPAVIITDEEHYDALKRIITARTNEVASGILSDPRFFDDPSADHIPETILISDLIKLAKGCDIDEGLLRMAEDISYDRMPLYVNFT